MNMFILSNKKYKCDISHFPVVSLPLFVLVLARCGSFPVVLPRCWVGVLQPAVPGSDKNTTGR